jgi:hypothetical protein
MAGLFNLPKQKQGTYLQTAFVSPGPEGNAEWGDTSVSMNDVYAWNALCEDVYFFLHLLGYSPTSVTFSVATGAATLDLNEMTLSAGYAKADIAIYFQPITSNSGKSFAIGIADFTHDETEYGGVLREPTRYLNVKSSSITIEVGAPHNTDRTSAEYREQLKFFLDLAVYKCLVPPLMARWWMAQSPPRALADVSTETELRDAEATAEAIRRIDADPKSDAKALGPDSSDPSGLLWLLNPDYWEEDVSRLLRSGAEAIWKRFSTTRFDKVYALLSETYVMSWDIYELQKPFPGLNPNLQDRYYRGIEEQSKTKQIFLPQRLLDNIGAFSYLELIMLLINYGIIDVPSLPAAFDKDTMDVTARPLEFYVLRDGGEEVGVELYLYDMGAPIRLEVVGMRDHSPRESFSWQFIAGQGQEMDTLLIVAAPGVKISGEKNISPYCRFQIYRVQDHGLVPGWFEPINSRLYEMPYFLERMPKDAFLNTQLLPAEIRSQFAASDEIPAFRVAPRPDGVTITYPSNDIFGPPSPYSFVPDIVKQYLGPASSWGYSLEVAITVSETAGDQRFSFSIEKLDTPLWTSNERAYEALPEGAAREFARAKAMCLFRQYALIVHYTGDVRISIKEPYPLISVKYGGDTLHSAAWVKYLVYEVKADPGKGITGDPLDAIWDIGEPLISDPGHEYVRRPATDTPVRLPIAMDIGDDNSTNSAYEAAYDALLGLGHQLGFSSATVPPTFTINKLYTYEGSDKEESVAAGRATLVPIASYVTSVPVMLTVMKMAIDVGIGFIPYVGDAVDALELMYAIKTGKDKWGEPVSNFEIQLMMAGTMAPLASSGALRHLGRAAQ